MRFHHRCYLASYGSTRELDATDLPGTRVEVWGRSREVPCGWGGLAARQGGARSCGMLSACGWWRSKARSFWLFLRRRLCSAGCVLERRGCVVILAVVYVKNDRAKSVGWKFFARSPRKVGVRVACKPKWVRRWISSDCFGNVGFVKEMRQESSWCEYSGRRCLVCSDTFSSQLVEQGNRSGARRGASGFALSEERLSQFNYLRFWIRSSSVRSSEGASPVDFHVPHLF